MQGLTVIFPYYMNPEMLKKQFEVFNSYSKAARRILQLIVVDDGSPIGTRAEEILDDLQPNGFDFRLYRILTDLRWNWLQCRNLGAKEAVKDWLLLTDIDHIIPVETMEKLATTDFDHRSFYTFARKNYTDKSPYHPHPNSYLMTRKRYWRIGGYDETFAGNYGTDGMWRRRCEENAAHVMLADCYLLRVDRKDIPDASTSPEVLQRKEGRDPNVLDDIRAYKERHGIGIQTLRLPWKRIV